MIKHEKNELFNPINRYLHSRRYCHITGFLKKQYGKKPVRILEIGVGHGRLYAELSNQLNLEYTGIELLEQLYQAAMEKHQGKDNFRLILGSVLDKDVHNQLDEHYDVVIALETFEHIHARNIPAVMDLFRNKVKTDFLLCSVPVETGFSVLLKNLGSWLVGYGRYKEYTASETIKAVFGKIIKLPPHSGTADYPRHKGFDWKVFRYLLHQDYAIQKEIHLPLGNLPVALSTNVLFITTPRFKLKEIS